MWQCYMMPFHEHTCMHTAPRLKRVPLPCIVTVPRDDDEDTPDRSHKPVPEWAKPTAVLQALKAQRHVDPDGIFGNTREETCDLAEMFKGEEE